MLDDKQYAQLAANVYAVSPSVVRQLNEIPSPSGWRTLEDQS